MKSWVWASAAALWATALHGSDVPIYQPAPQWAKPVDAAKLAKTGPVVAVHEDHTRFEGAKVLAYEERVWRLKDPSTLTRLGTITLSWSPDHGDLLIHKLELIRDGAVIDVLKSAKFTVLRRETALEKRVLTGALSATLAVPGAQVGDILHLAYGRVDSDGALGGHAQSLSSVPSGNDTPETGRIVTDWPSGQKVAVKIMPEQALPAIRTEGDRSVFELALPFAKPRPMPDDAPVRYRIPPLVMFADFADWQDVSRTFAPLFSKAAQLPGTGPLPAEVARIKALTPDKRGQMLAALQSVQDKIGYLLNGMSGGNYVPQPAEQTWTTRTGDCKAKTALLLSLLNGLGIQAEPILVNSSMMDAAAAGIPSASMFDHVLVRAHLGQAAYYLDGTSSGADSTNLADGPIYRWALPVSAAGAPLEALATKAPSEPEGTIATAIDLAAGPDFPGVVTATVTFTGPVVREMQAFEQVPAGRQQDDILDMALGRLFGEITVIDRKLAFDPKAKSATLSAQFVEDSRWKKDDQQWTYAPFIAGHPNPLKPDRSRASWAAIPVELGGPARNRMTVSMRMPEAGRGIRVEGGHLEFRARSMNVSQATTQADGVVTLVEDSFSDGGELAPTEIAEQRAKTAALGSATMKVILPADTPRSWQMTDAARRKPLKALIDAYSRLIVARPEESTGFAERGYVYAVTGQDALAAADFDRAIGLDASAGNYGYRAWLRELAGDLAGALADRQKASELDPGPARTQAIAIVLDKLGRGSEAIDLIEDALPSAGEDTAYLKRAKALALASSGKPQDGLEILEGLLKDKADDSDTLDFTCWYRGLWNVGIDAGQAQCDRAVTLASYSASALHSRAVLGLRRGKLDQARKDIDAAIDLDPSSEDYVLTRGLIRTAQGEAGGKADIADALRRDRTTDVFYRKGGLLR